MPDPLAAGLPPETLERALRLARVGVWEWEVASDVVRWSPGLYDIFGLDPATFPATYASYLQRVHPDDQAGLEATIQSALAKGEPYETRHRILRNDGETRWIHSLGEAEVAGGKVVRLRGVAMDVTETQEAQRLRELNEFRARFLNVAAHELKTPLTPIRLQTQILKMQLRDQPETVQRSLEVMQRGVDRLFSLVQDVLDAARLQATQLKVDKQAVDLGKLVHEALDTYRPVAKEVGIALDASVEAGIHVEADATRMMQVLNNLLSNAVKFTPVGGTIHVSLRRSQGDSVLAIQDTGRGLTTDQIQQLFQPFVQVHPDAEATLRGTGLGLYIVRGIVEEHGGSIGIQSAGPGKGTSVTVRLPLGSRSPRLPEKRSSPSPQMSALAARLRELV